MATENTQGAQTKSPTEGAQTQAPAGDEPQLMPEITFPNIGEPEPDEEPAVDPKEDLAAKIREELRAEWDAERANWQKTVDKLLQGLPAQAPQQPQQEPAPKAPALDFSNLPDPVDKPEEFRRAMQEQMSQSFQAQQEYLRHQYQQEQRQYQTAAQKEKALDDLWGKFQTSYSDLATKETLLRGAIQAESESYRQRGMDPADGILREPDDFMERVASRMRKELGAPAPAAPSPTPNRTGGLAGGTSYNGASNVKGKEPPGFLSQLKKAQADSGLI